jgi:hypothetical protein
MTIVKEELDKFIHTYSDAKLKIRQIDTGIVYDDAMDLKEYPHEYEETDEPIVDPDEPEPPIDEVDDTTEETE